MSFRIEVQGNAGSADESIVRPAFEFLLNHLRGYGLVVTGGSVADSNGVVDFTAVMADGTETFLFGPRAGQPMGEVGEASKVAPEFLRGEGSPTPGVGDAREFGPQ